MNKKNIGMILLCGCLLFTLSACSEEESTTSAQSSSEASTSDGAASQVESPDSTTGIVVEDSIVPEFDDPSELSVKTGSNVTYMNQILDLYSNFLAKQSTFGKLAGDFYRDPTNLTYVADIDIVIEALIGILMDTAYLTPPENMVKEQQNLIAAAYRLVEVLEEYAVYYEGSLEFESENKKKMYEGLTTYYSGKSKDFLDLLTELKEKT